MSLYIQYLEERQFLKETLRLRSDHLAPLVVIHTVKLHLFGYT